MINAAAPLGIADIVATAVVPIAKGAPVGAQVVLAAVLFAEVGAEVGAEVVLAAELIAEVGAEAVAAVARINGALTVWTIQSTISMTNNIFDQIVYGHIGCWFVRSRPFILLSWTNSTRPLFL